MKQLRISLIQTNPWKPLLTDHPPADIANQPTNQTTAHISFYFITSSLPPIRCLQPPPLVTKDSRYWHTYRHALSYTLPKAREKGRRLSDSGTVDPRMNSKSHDLRVVANGIGFPDWPVGLDEPKRAGEKRESRSIKRCMWWG